MDAALGRTMSRQVLAELAAGWGRTWAEVAEIQQRNPDILAAALNAPADPVDGIAGIGLALAAELHPQVVASAQVFCTAVSDELSLPVTPRREDPQRGERKFVSDGEDGEVNEDLGGQQQHDRLAELEAKFERIEALVIRLVADPRAVERLRAKLRDDQLDVPTL